jgi:DNA-binding response OmpR family regulator
MSGSPYILMVEPDVLVRQPIAEYLRECRYKVVETGSTDEALLVVNARTMSIDIVLADAKAPGKLDGFGLARWMRENRPSAKVILAGTVANEAKEAGDLCEEGPLLSKPYDPQLLVDRIKRAVATRDRINKL